MKLPEQMPEELQNSIDAFISCTVSGDVLKKIALSEFLPIFYNFFKDYFNNYTTKWYPVSEKPEHDCDVWLWDGNNVYKGMYVSFYQHFEPQFYGTEAKAECSTIDCENCGSEQVIDDDLYIKASTKPIQWAYAHLPEPPKE